MALRIVVAAVATFVTSAQAAAPPRQASSPTARTAEEQTQVETLFRLAQQEGQADTDLPERLRVAAGSGNPWVRANAFAVAPMVLVALDATGGARSVARRAEFADLCWTLGQRGLEDADESVRRYALAATGASAVDAARSAAFRQRVRTVFDRDPAGAVRARAFEFLTLQVGMPELDMALVEQAIADVSPAVKHAGFNALWLRQAPGYLAVMLARLHDERDGNTRVAAAEALRNVVPINGSVVDAVADRLAVEPDPAVRQRLSTTLAQMRDLAARIRKPGR